MLTAIATPQSEIVRGSRRVEKDSFRPATVMTLSRSDNVIDERQSIGGAPWQINGCPLKPTVVASCKTVAPMKLLPRSTPT